MIDGQEHLSPGVRRDMAEGMARADAGATAEAKAEFEDAVLQIAHRQPFLTVDDVKSGFPHLTLSDNASGPAMKRMATKGVLVSAGRVLSQRITDAVGHRPRAIVRWQSTVHPDYQPNAAVISDDDRDRVAHLAHTYQCPDAEIVNVALDLLEERLA